MTLMTSLRQLVIGLKKNSWLHICRKYTRSTADTASECLDIIWKYIHNFYPFYINHYVFHLFLVILSCLVGLRKLRRAGVVDARAKLHAQGCRKVWKSWGTIWFIGICIHIIYPLDWDRHNWSAKNWRSQCSTMWLIWLFVSSSTEIVSLKTMRILPF